MAERIVITSGKGGVGKSSITAGLACALQRKGHSVLVVDCDIGLCSLDIILGAKSDMLFNWGDIICSRCSSDAALTETGYGPALLCAPKRFEPEYTQQAIQSLAQEYEERFDYIIFDSPAGLGTGFKLAAAAANKAIVVSTPDEVCVRSAAAAADSLSEFGIAESRLIINRFERKATIKGKLLNVDDVIDSTRLRLIGVVPYDRNVMFNMCCGKRLPDKSSAAQAFERIARRMDGDRVHLVIS